MKTITPKEAAELLQVDRVTIWRWKDKYLFPVGRKGPGETSAILYDRAQVIQLAKELGRDVSEYEKELDGNGHTKQ